MPSTSEKWKAIYLQWSDLQEHMSQAQGSVPSLTDDDSKETFKGVFDTMAAHGSSFKTSADSIATALGDASPKFYEGGLTKTYGAAVRASSQLQALMGEYQQFMTNSGQWVMGADTEKDDDRSELISRYGNSTGMLIQIVRGVGPDLDAIGRKVKVQVTRK